MEGVPVVAGALLFGWFVVSSVLAVLVGAGLREAELNGRREQRPSPQPLL